MIAHLKAGRAELERTLLSENLKTILFKYSNVSPMPLPKQHCTAAPCLTILQSLKKKLVLIQKFITTPLPSPPPPSNQQYCGNLKTSLLSSSNFEEIVSFFLPLMTKLFSLICKHELNTVLEVLNHRLSGAC